MKLQRFIYDIDVNKPTGIIADSAVAKQIRLVLRLTVGDTVIICDGKGFESMATIVDNKGDRLELSFEPPTKVSAEPPRQVTLYCSVLKKENFEWVAQKAVEVGISVIVPLMCERTVKLNLNSARIQKIMREATEQSGRGLVPTLQDITSFDTAIMQAKKCAVSILFDDSGQAFSSANMKDNQTASIFIGPEGGFSPNELALAKKAGLTCCTLGLRTLRAETAAVVASYLTTL